MTVTQDLLDYLAPRGRGGEFYQRVLDTDSRQVPGLLRRTVPFGPHPRRGHRRRRGRRHVQGSPRGCRRSSAPGRVRTTPISEQAVVGAAIGSAIAGMRPVAEIMLMDSYYPGWLVFVDDGGHRFVNEQAAYSVVESTFQARDGRAWATFDDAAKRAAVPRSTAAAKKYDMPTGSNWEDWVEPVIDEMAAKGIVLVAGTVRELAESVGLPPRALEGELGRYNEDVLAGEDTQFGKSPVVMRTVAEPPFYATQMRLCNVSLTACGPRVDAASRVLDEGSQAIPGLYAAGSARAACSATSTWAAATRWRTRSRSAGSPGRPPRPARSSPGSGP